MRYTRLGDSALEVPEICLGTMTFGEQNSQREAHDQLDHAVGRGVNFIDAAEMYSVPPRAETQGLLLHRQVRFDVLMRCGRALVVQPQGDYADVHGAQPPLGNAVQALLHHQPVLAPVVAARAGRHRCGRGVSGRRGAGLGGQRAAELGAEGRASHVLGAVGSAALISTHCSGGNRGGPCRPLRSRTVDLEHRHHLGQPLRLGAEAACRGGTFFHQRSVLLRHLIHLRHGLVDLAAAGLHLLGAGVRGHNADGVGVFRRSCDLSGFDQTDCHSQRAGQWRPNGDGGSAASQSCGVHGHAAHPGPILLQA